MFESYVLILFLVISLFVFYDLLFDLVCDIEMCWEIRLFGINRKEIFISIK